VELSSGDNDRTSKAPAGDDAEGQGASSAEPIATNQIISSVLEQAKPSAGDRVYMATPSTGGQKQKRLPPALKHQPSTD
jgi:hypothetical protein